jgi:hypothetical protein
MTDPTQNREAAVVTQADRDAAADFLLLSGDSLTPFERQRIAELRSGEWDAGPTAQAFARHRLTTERATEAAGETVVVPRGLSPKQMAAACEALDMFVSSDEDEAIVEAIVHAINTAAPATQAPTDAAAMREAAAKVAEGEACRDEAAEPMWIDACQTVADRIRALPITQAAPLADEGRAICDIAHERQRQISDEGWIPDHDDQHGNGEIAAAAGAYAFAAATEGSYFAADPIGFWPWEPKWFKPSDARRSLVKAGALIVAEIERLDRAALKDTPHAG